MSRSSQIEVDCLIELRFVFLPTGIIMQVLYEVLFVISDYSIDFSLRIRIFIVFQSMPPAVFSSRSVLSVSKSKKSRSARCLPGPGFAVK